MEPKQYLDYDNYLIYPDGRIYSKRTKDFMSCYLNPVGYYTVGFSKDGERSRFYVHRLVAECFVPNPQNLPEVNHIDENKLNNHVDNLEWCSREYNCSYGTRSKKIGEKCGKSVEMLDLKTGEVLQTFSSMAEASRQTGINRNGISMVCNGHRKMAGGYGWQCSK